MAEPRRALFALTKVRVLIFLREPEAVFWVFVFPLVLAVVLGFAFDGDEATTAVVAVPQGIEGDALVARLERAPNCEVRRVADALEGETAVRMARVDLFLDPVEGNLPTLVRQPGRPESELARLRVLRVLEGRGPEISPAVASDRALDERGSRYLDFLFPGLIGLNILGTGVWGVGFAVADLRSKKLFKRLLVTPVRRSEILLSFVAARAVWLGLELVVLLSFGVWALGVPLNGSIVALGLLAFVAGLTCAGLGLLGASRVRTIEGASGVMNLIMMPMWLGSGVFFSYERFPEVLHPVLALLPLSPVNDGLRAVMLEGAGVADVAQEIAIIGAWGVLAFVGALKLFRWK